MGSRKAPGHTQTVSVVTALGVCWFGSCISPLVVGLLKRVGFWPDKYAYSRALLTVITAGLLTSPALTVIHHIRVVSCWIIGGELMVDG